MAVVMSTDLLRQAAAKLRDPLLCNFPTKVGLPLANWLSDTAELQEIAESVSDEAPTFGHALAVAEGVLSYWWD